MNLNFGFFSHFPVLAAAVSRTVGSVLELGCGDASTLMLSLLCRDRVLFSCDTNEDWLSKFEPLRQANKSHYFVHVKDWKTFAVVEAQEWGCAFVDCQPGEAREHLIRKLKNRCDLIVAHDSEKDHGSGGNYQYEKVIPEFKYVSEYRLIRPYTLILSNVMDFPLCDFEKVWEAPNEE